MKTTMRCYHISLRLLSKEKKRKKEKKMPRVGKSVEKLELLHTAGRNVKWCGHYGKGCVVPQKLKNRITIQPSNPTSGYLPPTIESETLRRYLYINIYSSIIHNT